MSEEFPFQEEVNFPWGSLSHHCSLSPGLHWESNSSMCWRPLQSPTWRGKVHTQGLQDFPHSLPSLHYLCVCLWRLIINLDPRIDDYWNNFTRSRRKIYRSGILSLELNLLKVNNLNGLFVWGCVEWVCLGLYTTKLH